MNTSLFPVANVLTSMSLGTSMLLDGTSKRRLQLQMNAW